MIGHFKPRLERLPPAQKALWSGLQPEAERETLLNLAGRYLWWEAPEAALRRPRRVIAQVMELGTWEDVHDLLRVIGEEPFRDALLHAGPGWFEPRSWHYWWHRPGLVQAAASVPALPVRTYGAA
jgi:hypothetical protein